jgi:hypothetical protein
MSAAAGVLTALVSSSATRDTRKEHGAAMNGGRAALLGGHRHRIRLGPVVVSLLLACV